MGDLVEELAARDVLHHQVDVLGVVVRFVVLHNVRVVQLVQNGHFFHYACDIVTQFVLVEHFDGNLEIGVKFVCGHENAPKCSRSKHTRILRNIVVLFQLVNALLLATLTHRDRMLPRILLLGPTIALLLLLC